MSDADEPARPPRKLLIAALAAVFLTLVGSAAVLVYLGLFSTVRLDRLVTPSYRIAYLTHTGPYNEIGDMFEEVEARLGEAGIRTVAPCALFLDDPSVVAKERLRSKVGYLVPRSDFEHASRALQVEEIAPREVIRATFSGSPLVGSYKAYSAMKQWSAENGYTLNLPSLEIYYPGGTEYQLPITPRR